MTVECEGCGQTCLPDDAWTVRGLCPTCRAGQYGGAAAHEAPRLFEPAPVQLAGQLDLSGVDLPACEWCGGAAAAGTCPRSVACPSCAAAPGAPCKRPSGHRAAELHAARVELAEAS